MSIGSISGSSSIYNTMNSLAQTKKSEEELKEMVETNDVDKNGTLNKDEFTAMSKGVTDDSETSAALADALFGMFDKDGDGELTAEEIQAGRESLISTFDREYGSLDTMAQVNSVLNQTQQTLIDLMDHSSGGNGDDDDDNAFDFLTNDYNARVQEYLSQAEITKSGDYSAEAVNNLLNGSSSLSELI